MESQGVLGYGLYCDTFLIVSRHYLVLHHQLLQQHLPQLCHKVCYHDNPNLIIGVVKVQIIGLYMVCSSTGPSLLALHNMLCSFEQMPQDQGGEMDKWKSILRLVLDTCKCSVLL